MPRDALRALNAAAQQHAHVPCGGEQHHGTHEEGHPNGDTSGQPRVVAQRLNASSLGKGTEGQRNQRDDPIELVGFSVSAFGGQPGGSNEVEG